MVSSDHFLVSATIRATKKLLRKRFPACGLGRNVMFKCLLNILSLLRWRMYITHGKSITYALDCCLPLKPPFFEKRKGSFFDSELIEVKFLNRQDAESFRRIQTVELRETLRQRTLNFLKKTFRKKRSLFTADTISGVWKKNKFRLLYQLKRESPNFLPKLIAAHLELADKLNCFFLEKVNESVNGFLESCLDFDPCKLFHRLPRSYCSPAS